MGNTEVQAARYNHVLGPCKAGLIGVLFQAYEDTLQVLKLVTILWMEH